MSSVYDIQHLWRLETRDEEEMKVARSFSLETAKETALQNSRGNQSRHRNLKELGKQTLKNISFSCRKSGLKRCELVLCNESWYSLFTFEHLYNLHLEASKLVRQWEIAYFTPDTLKTSADKPG